MNVKRILATKGTNVITIRPEQTIKEAVRLLARHNIGAVVVVGEDGKVAGILSERDVIRRAAQRDDVLRLKVEDVMTHDVITAMPQDDLRSIANTMTQHRFRHLPIVDGDRLVGMVSVTDVIKAERDAYRGEVDTLQTQMLGEEE
ncbi:MAG: CBS domain-containing protein [Caldilineae bacterium]|nr:MAG: CBS domain-containing protein [Caldilineae bacterium]